MISNKLKNLFLISVALILAGCQPEQNDKELVIYTIDMLYACEGPRYRVFRVVDKTLEPERIVQLPVHFDEPRTKQDRILQEESMQIDEIEYTPKDSLIGLDVLPVFSDKAEEQRFQSQIASSPFCYIYSFTGTFMSKQKFKVQSYQVIPVNQECIQQNKLGIQ